MFCQWASSQVEKQTWVSLFPCWYVCVYPLRVNVSTPNTIYILCARESHLQPQRTMTSTEQHSTQHHSIQNYISEQYNTVELSD